MSKAKKVVFFEGTKKGKQVIESKNLSVLNLQRILGISHLDALYLLSRMIGAGMVKKQKTNKKMSLTKKIKKVIEGL